MYIYMYIYIYIHMYINKFDPPKTCGVKPRKKTYGKKTHDYK